METLRQSFTLFQPHHAPPTSQQWIFDQLMAAAASSQYHPVTLNHFFSLFSRMHDSHTHVGKRRETKHAWNERASQLLLEFQIR